LFDQPRRVGFFFATDQSVNHQVMFSSHFQEIKLFLDQKADFYNKPAFIKDDPISVPHQFNSKEDIEISAFLAATLAWGNRKSIIRNAKNLIDLMDNSPYDFIRNFDESDLVRFSGFVHRTFNSDDCIFFLVSLKNIYQNHGGLEKAFSPPEGLPGEYVYNAILHFRKIFLDTEHLARTEKHISDPQKKSSAKRLNMFLRWMVRKDNQGVDFGIWNSMNARDLICPLDVHTGNTARKLGFLTRNANDWKSALELTSKLRLFDPEDPVKYDFALFGMGVFEKH
jgi:uncharacterized protein (TIGR02757 family)